MFFAFFNLQLALSKKNKMTDYRLDHTQTELIDIYSYQQ